MDREREARLHPAEEILVPGEGQVGVQAALKEICTPPRSTVSWNFLASSSRDSTKPSVLMRGRAVEVAELAARDADVRVVDVAVDDVRDLVARVQRAAARVGGGAELERRRLGVEAQPVLGREARARGGVGEQRVDGVRARRGQPRRTPAAFRVAADVRLLVEAQARALGEEPGGVAAVEEAATPESSSLPRR